MNIFDTLKEHNGKRYSGMSIGSAHHWHYNDAEWHEEKTAPDTWHVTFTATKKRHTSAPLDSGAPVGTEYHWLLITDQVVRKKNADEYETVMTGEKYKVGHKRPYWRAPSYCYPDQLSLKEQKLALLRKEIERLEVTP